MKKQKNLLRKIIGLGVLFLGLIFTISIVHAYQPYGGGGGFVLTPTVSITASSTTIRSGTSTTISWSSAKATSCSVSGPNISSSATHGSASTGNLTTSATYGITCSNTSGSASAYTSVAVLSPPTVSIRSTAGSSYLNYNTATTISWSSSGAFSCTTSGPGISSYASGGSVRTGALTGDATYKITCSNSVGSATKSVLVVVVPTITPSNSHFWSGVFGGSSVSNQIRSISSGNKISLNWNVRGTGATSCYIKNTNTGSTIHTLTSSDLSTSHGHINTGTISTPTNYSLTCLTTPMNPSISHPSTGHCQGTVAGSTGPVGTPPHYQIPGPYEGQSCSQFTTESTCMQGWITHGCVWVSS